MFDLNRIFDKYAPQPCKKVIKKEKVTSYSDVVKKSVGKQVTVVVVPEDNNVSPYEMRIRSSISSKQDFLRYLSENVDVFKWELLRDYDSKKSVGIYWRNIVQQYKKKCCLCAVFRFSQGERLKKNDLFQMWRSDPQKSTFGPVVLLKIQDGDKEFKYESYELHQFYRQCAHNLQVYMRRVKKN